MAAPSILDSTASVADSDSASSVTISGYTPPAGSNRKVIVMAGVFKNPVTGTTLTCSFGGTAMEKIDQVQTGVYERFAIFQALEADFPGGGSGDIVFDVGISSSDVAAVAFTIQDAEQVALASMDTPTKAGSTSTSITPSAANSLVLGFGHGSVSASAANWTAGLTRLGVTGAPGAGSWPYAGGGDTSTILVGYAAQGASSLTCTHNMSAGRPGIILAAFQEAAGGANTDVTPDALSNTTTLNSIGVALGRNVSLDALSLSTSLHALTIGLSRPVPLDSLSLSSALHDASVGLSRSVSPDALSLSMSLHDVAINTSVGTDVDLDALALSASLHDTTEAIGRAVDLDALAYSSALHDADMSIGRGIDLDALSYSLALHDTSETLARSVGLDALTYSLTLQNVGISTQGDTPVSLDALGVSTTVNDISVDVGRMVSSDTLALSVSLHDVAITKSVGVTLDALSFISSLQPASIVVGDNTPKLPYISITGNPDAPAVLVGNPDPITALTGNPDAPTALTGDQAMDAQNISAFTWGADLVIDLTAKNADGSALSSPDTQTIKIAIGATQAGAALLDYDDKASHSGSSVFRITLAPADYTATLKEGRTYYYTIWSQLGAASPVPQAKGTLTIGSSVAAA